MSTGCYEADKYIDRAARLERESLEKKVEAGDARALAFSVGMQEFDCGADLSVCLRDALWRTRLSPPQALRLSDDELNKLGWTLRCIRELRQLSASRGIA